MNTQKLMMVLLVLVIVFSVITIVMNLSTESRNIDQSPNVIITDPDDGGSAEVGLVILPKGETG